MSGDVNEETAVWLGVIIGVALLCAFGLLLWCCSSAKTTAGSEQQNKAKYNQITDHDPVNDTDIETDIEHETIETITISHDTNKDVKQWFDDEVNLEESACNEYYDMFIKNEYRNLDIIGTVTLEHLKGFGIENEVHRKEILIAISKLKINEDEEQKEELSHIPISQTNLIISSGGFDEINGEYRWFVALTRWCLFREDQSYAMENGVDSKEVYKQLNIKQNSFKWNDEVTKCWTISKMDGDEIYYAAPQMDDKYIPNNKDLWIAVHGSLPSPNIYMNLLEVSNDAKDDQFEFADMKLQTINELKQEDVDQEIVVDDEEEDESIESLSDL